MKHHAIQIKQTLCPPPSCRWLLQLLSCLSLTSAASVHEAMLHSECAFWVCSSMYAGMHAPTEQHDSRNSPTACTERRRRRAERGTPEAGR